MKKPLLILICLIASIACSLAQNPQDGETVILNGIVDDPSGAHGSPHKGSVGTVNATLYGRTLIFGSSYVGCTVTVASSNAVVYSSVTDESGCMVLPEDLSGCFEIRLYVGIYCFVGEITL